MCGDHRSLPESCRTNVSQPKYKVSVYKHTAMDADWKVILIRLSILTPGKGDIEASPPSSGLRKPMEKTRELEKQTWP